MLVSARCDVLAVDLAVCHGERPLSDNTGTNVVFVGNLAWSTNEDNLRAFASSVGPVLSVQIQTHADTGRSKGWG